MGSEAATDALTLERRASRRQCAEAVLVVRPAAFGYNSETASTNTLQRPALRQGSAALAGVRARVELEGLIAALSGEGVSVCAVEDTADPPKPDAVFPNNWVSFHEDGTLVLYPLHAPSRRLERRQEVIDAVVEKLGFKVARVLDLTGHEAERRYLEGTGSLVLDHLERVAYACISPRTDRALVEGWSRELGYEPVVFTARDRSGTPLYHTNVLMCVGEKLAVLGTEAIDAADRGRVLERLRGSRREVIEIGHGEIERFAGNMLELATWDEALGDYRLLVMSETTRHALDSETFGRLSACTDEVVVVPVGTIEQLGGGGVRCMLTEVFLPA